MDQDSEYKIIFTYLRFPANRHGSWRIIVILERRSSKLILEISLPSKKIYPSYA